MMGLLSQVTKMIFDSDLLSTESVRAASNIYMVVVDLCSRKASAGANSGMMR